MLKKIYISLIVLCGLYFYELSILGKFAKFSHLIGIGIIFFLIILYGTNDTSFKFKSNFKIFILIILISIPTSMYIANTEYDQKLSLSLLEQRHLFYYFTYFAIHLVKAKPKDIERLFIYFGILYIIIYFIQMIAFPYEVFNVKMFKERGTIRIFLPGISYMVIGYFYTLQQFLERNKLKYLIFNFVSLSIIILLGGRSLLFIVLLVTIINLIISKRIKSRLIIYVLSILGGIIIIIIFKNIFIEMLEVTERTKRSGVSNIRIRAMIFYFKTLFPTGLSYIFGNGMASGKSEFGHTIFLYSAKYGYYLSDIGIIGNYINYGLFFVIGVIGLLWKIFKIKIQSTFYHFKYFFMVILLSIPTGGAFADSELIVVVCLSLYILDVSAHMKRNEKEVT